MKTKSDPYSKIQIQIGKQPLHFY